MKLYVDYYCEIAVQELKQNTIEKAYQSVQQALMVDANSVRASLMLAKMEMQAGRYKQAVEALQQVPEQDPEFLNEIIEPFVFCHRELDSMDECIGYLEQTMATHPRASVIFVIGDYLTQEKSVDFAIDFVFIAFMLLNVLSLFSTYKINDRYSFLKYRYSYYKKSNN